MAHTASRLALEDGGDIKQYQSMLPQSHPSYTSLPIAANTLDAFDTALFLDRMAHTRHSSKIANSSNMARPSASVAPAQQNAAASQTQIPPAMTVVLPQDAQFNLDNLPLECSVFEMSSRQKCAASLPQAIVPGTINSITNEPLLAGPCPLVIGTDIKDWYIHVLQSRGFGPTDIAGRIPRQHWPNDTTNKRGKVRPGEKKLENCISVRAQRFRSRIGILDYYGGNVSTYGEGTPGFRAHVSAVGRLSDLQLLYNVCWNVFPDRTMAQPWVSNVRGAQQPPIWNPRRWQLPQPKEVSARVRVLLQYLGRPVPTLANLSIYQAQAGWHNSAPMIQPNAPAPPVTAGSLAVLASVNDQTQQAGSPKLLDVSRPPIPATAPSDVHGVPGASEDSTKLAPAAHLVVTAISALANGRSTPSMRCEQSLTSSAFDGEFHTEVEAELGIDYHPGFGPSLPENIGLSHDVIDPQLLESANQPVTIGSSTLADDLIDPRLRELVDQPTAKEPMTLPDELIDPRLRAHSTVAPLSNNAFTPQSHLSPLLGSTGPSQNHPTSTPSSSPVMTLKRGRTDDDDDNGGGTEVFRARPLKRTKTDHPSKTNAAFPMISASVALTAPPTASLKRKRTDTDDDEGILRARTPKQPKTDRPPVQQTGARVIKKLRVRPKAVQQTKVGVSKPVADSRKPSSSRNGGVNEVDWDLALALFPPPIPKDLNADGPPQVQLPRADEHGSMSTSLLPPQVQDHAHGSDRFLGGAVPMNRLELAKQSGEHDLPDKDLDEV